MSRRGDTLTRGHGAKKASRRVHASTRQRIAPVITLLTDFGTADYFVGAMKGAILSVNPAARIFDLTHEIPPHDIQAGAFALLASHTAFPPGTIHVAVVDPGVGSARRPLVASLCGQLFVGPDNGLFSYVYEREGAAARVFHLTREEYFRQPVSETFHGRDIFAPVAGALSNGVAPDGLGAEITDYARLAPYLPVERDDGSLEGSIIHIDRFGNCVTNFTREHLQPELLERGARILINDDEIVAFRRYYAEADAPASELFAIWGSAGFLEISANRDSAARRLQARRGQNIKLKR
jgi:S-adenosyl-L-methionine hydrolase (adenosine-forming)